MKVTNEKVPKEKCYRCKKVKPVSDFHKKTLIPGRGQRKVQAYCKECVYEVKREWNAKNRRRNQIAQNRRRALERVAKSQDPQQVLEYIQSMVDQIMGSK